MTKAVNLMNYSMSHRFYPTNAMHMVCLTLMYNDFVDNEWVIGA